MSNKIDLPHGAWLETEKKIVNIPLGAITISLQYEEFLEFAAQMDDISVYFQSNADLESYLCENCGNVTSVISFVPPGGEGDEYN